MTKKIEMRWLVSHVTVMGYQPTDWSLSDRVGWSILGGHWLEGMAGEVQSQL